MSPWFIILKDARDVSGPFVYHLQTNAVYKKRSATGDSGKKPGSNGHLQSSPQKYHHAMMFASCTTRQGQRTSNSLASQMPSPLCACGADMEKLKAVVQDDMEEELKEMIR